MLANGTSTRWHRRLVALAILVGDAILYTR